MSDTIPVLSRLRNVDLREVWPSEPYSFTPWLAQPDSLQFLADALGIPSLELIATERQVDIFSADIVARAPTSGETVLIENQIERSDHTHLGQILTYAAGLDAAIVVWIAKRFTDGHRAAIDWLNRITAQEFAFFGVEVEALRIGDSAPAPRFTVVARPNEFSRELKAVARSQDATPESEAFLAYWAGFEAAAKQVGAPVREAGKPVRSTNYYIRLGQLGQVYLTAFRSAASQAAGVYLSLFGHATSAAIYAHLQSRREEIESAFGGELDWVTRPNGVYWVLAPKLTDARLETADWPRQHAWLAQHMKRLANAVSGPVAEAQDGLPEGDG